MSRLAVALCFMVATSAVFAQQLEDSEEDGVRPRPDELTGSGDDDGSVTRPRPSDDTTTQPGVESTECKCLLASGEKTYKLHQLIQDVSDEVEMEYVDSDEGCEAVRSKCTQYCAGVGSSLFNSGYSVKLSGGRFKRHSLGDVLCSGASSEDPMAIEITSRLRCRGGASHHKRYDEYMASYKFSAPLCCAKGAKSRFSPVSCSTDETDSGSGDDGVRPRPEEELAGSGDDGVRPRPEEQFAGSGDDGVRPRPEVELAGDDEVEVTRPRPEEETTESATPEPTTEKPETESTECKCFLASGKKSYKLHQLMKDAPEEVEMEYLDTDEGCADVRSKCAKHCAGVGSGLLTSGYSAKIAGGRFRRYSLGNLLCSGARSTEPMTVEITSRLRCRGGASKHSEQDEFMTAHSSSAPLCCTRENKWRFSAVSCPAA